jgi:hypothetical protein
MASIKKYLKSLGTPAAVIRTMPAGTRTVPILASTEVAIPGHHIIPSDSEPSTKNGARWLLIETRTGKAKRLMRIVGQ